MPDDALLFQGANIIPDAVFHDCLEILVLIKTVDVAKIRVIRVHRPEHFLKRFLDQGQISAESIVFLFVSGAEVHLGIDFIPAAGDRFSEQPIDLHASAAHIVQIDAVVYSVK